MTAKPKAKAKPRSPSTQPGRKPTAEDLAHIIDAMADRALSLRAACRELGVHAPSTATALQADPDLHGQYLAARAMRGDDYGEKVADVVEMVRTKKITPDIGRVMIDGLKWTAARMAPKGWGDKVHTEHSGSVTLAHENALDQLE